ncbi:hypothetical protein J8L98_03980 [Pseudoalteromonas sp. MMG013]|uniref:hypothetical protein n=1 Tax=Pseudoalteromonas sp. MMG013 TaxID=2822687 RepID=UPI001B38CF25|nr:hypothetical protein [Pseudoalteromonas sp. MMG013]MBQ4860855.1 hypothetical protein [Pseudoalteromonas sp. MMG013]
MVKQQYLVLFLLLSLVGIVSYSQYNLLPANAIFELLVLVSLLFIGKRMQPSAWALFLLSLGYLLVTLALAKLRAVHPVDYFIAYKTFFYLCILSFFSSKVLFGHAFVRKAWYALLGLFFFKYIVWTVLGAEGRPGLFTENNFEIMFLLLIGCAVWSIRNHLTLYEWMALGGVTFLSGSRSGVICFLAMFVLLYIKEMNWKTILQLGLVGGVGAGVAAIFISRLAGGGIEQIDRVVFFQGFLLGIADWGWWEYLLGSQTLTALPPEVCDRLTYYQSLFSAKDPSICYSVILHTYITRTIFDHGFIGLFFIFFALNYLLKLSHVVTKARLAVLAILFLNGASVSSINSVYAVVGVMVILTTFYPHRYGFEKARLILQRKAMIDSQ